MIAKPYFYNSSLMAGSLVKKVVIVEGKALRKNVFCSAGLIANWNFFLKKWINYYPFGLTMVGISSKAASLTANKEKTFQGQRVDDELGLNWIQFKWRNHDPQNGRFIEIDPLANDYVYNSTYAFSENKVTAHVELEGLESRDIKDINLPPAVRALANENVQKPLESANRNGAEAVEVKINIGIGVVGVKAKVGDVGVDATASGLQGEFAVNGAGKTNGQASVAGAGVQIETPVGNVKAGGNVGVVEYKDGKVGAKTATGGASGSLAVTKDVKDGNVSQSLAVNILNTTVTLGAKFGVVGLQVSANMYKAGAAVVDLFSALGNWMMGTIQETTKIPQSSDFPPR